MKVEAKNVTNHRDTRYKRATMYDVFSNGLSLVSLDAPPSKDPEGVVRPFWFGDQGFKDSQILPFWLSEGKKDATGFVGGYNNMPGLIRRIDEIKDSSDGKGIGKILYAKLNSNFKNRVNHFASLLKGSKLSRDLNPNVKTSYDPNSKTCYYPRDHEIKTFFDRLKYYIKKE
ncbi:MAG: hypothetical protein DRQ88_00795 [Epsilonproteobacteria bacterium]|nr:MAG: hypothetical protein DRQ89_10330 [Campylobacterota bacterium]RLA68172.1 MAG: hypothetical protein DRQ88_00795 [Campylobacterota bacterium]